MAHFDEGRAYGKSSLDVEEDCSSFCLGGVSHGSLDGPTFCEDWSIWSGSRPDVGRWWIVTQLVVSCSATARFGLNEIRCVTADVKSHVDSVEPDDGIQLRGCVVHQNLSFLDGVGGGKRLLGADLVERNKHGGVDGARDVDKGDNDALHARDSAFIKFR